MEFVKALFEINYQAFVVSVLTVVLALKFLTELGKWLFVDLLGLETKAMRKRREEHELLITTADELKKLSEKHKLDVQKSIEHDEKIEKELQVCMQEIKQTVAENSEVMRQYAENRVHDREQSRNIQLQLTNTIQDLAASQENRDQQIKDLTDMFLNKEINDIRWELLDFCSALTGGRKYNREAFEHIFKIYEEYEQILEKHHMTNGFVTESMDAVREIYREKLVSGEFS